MSERLAELLVAVELELDQELMSSSEPLFVPKTLPLAAALGARLSALAALELHNLTAPPPPAFAGVPDARYLQTIDQVAARLDVKAARVRELYRKGQLPVVNVGRLVRFRPEDVDRWIAERTDGKRAT